MGLDQTPRPAAPVRPGSGDRRPSPAAGSARRAPAAPPVAFGSSPQQIEVQLAQVRERLAGTIDELRTRTDPKRLVDDAKARARAIVVNADGSLRVERLVKVGGTVAAVVVAMALLRKLLHR